MCVSMVPGVHADLHSRRMDTCPVLPSGPLKQIRRTRKKVIRLAYVQTVPCSRPRVENYGSFSSPILSKSHGTEAIRLGGGGD